MAIEVKTSKNKFTIKNNCIFIGVNIVEMLGLNRDQYYTLVFSDKNELILTKTEFKVKGLKFVNTAKTFKMALKPEYIPNKWQLFFSSDKKVDYRIEEDSIIITLK